MAETGLAEILSRTLQQANAHTRGVFGGDNAMSAQEVADFLEENSVAVVSTVTASGTPHSTGVGTTFVDGKLYFGASEARAMSRNLERNPSVAVAVVELPWKRHVLIQGSVRFLSSDSPELPRVHAVEVAKHGWESEIVAEVVPGKIYTWKE